MSHRLRPRIRALQAYAGGTTAALIFMATVAMSQSSGSQRMRELTVQRVNIVDANGTLRMVLSNKDRMHPGVIDGVTMERERPVAGLLFFNDVGDEVGGLVYSGQEVDGRPRASGSLTLDQWKQDQTIGLQYAEQGGRRLAALRVWDRSDTQRLSALVERMNAANRIVDAKERAVARDAVMKGAEPGHERVFVGKDFSSASVVTLADAAGKARLVLRVQADGAAAIEFLDQNGTVTSRLPR